LAEWTKALVLKTRGAKAPVSSNLTGSAMDTNLLRQIAACADCKIMLENYQGILMIEHNWIKRVWKAHKYKEHRLTP
jgi:hypothetical protein